MEPMHSRCADPTRMGELLNILHLLDHLPTISSRRHLLVDGAIHEKLLTWMQRQSFGQEDAILADTKAMAAFSVRQSPISTDPFTYFRLCSSTPMWTLTCAFDRVSFGFWVLWQVRQLSRLWIGLL
jgi:hypothetical protein